MNELLFMLLAGVFSIGQITAQEKVIHGKVTTMDSIPLIGVSVRVNSTKKVVYSDTLGRFTVLCAARDRVKFTARGFVNKQVKTDEKSKYIFMNLKLKPDPEYAGMASSYVPEQLRHRLRAGRELHEVDEDFSMYDDVYDIIYARIPGVEINADGEIIIRGSQTFLGSDAALLVVDDVVVNQRYFENLQPSDVSSIHVLKGADASGYGSRGANGVVIVRTKRGQ